VKRWPSQVLHGPSAIRRASGGDLAELELRNGRTLTAVQISNQAERTIRCPLPSRGADHVRIPRISTASASRKAGDHTAENGLKAKNLEAWPASWERVANDRCRRRVRQ